MKMLHACLNYLSDPHLVIKTQEFFGVRYITKTNGSKEIGKNDNSNCINKPSPKKSNDRSKKENFGIKRIPSSASTSSNASSENDHSAESESEDPPCLVTNNFWYYLFVISTALGDEIFYATFIPFWFWNIDGAVGRRVVLVWTIIMYIGQGFKDVIKMPRPGPPVQKLQKKWALEYGMPSTHAMVGIAIPFSILFYTMNRYQYSFAWGLFLATLWCGLICVSRVYLGMHSVLDIVAGLLLAISLMIPLVPLVDAMDIVLLTNRLSPVFVLVVSILGIIYYPNSDKWTPTRGDTTMVVSVCSGIHIGAWVNYQLGHMVASELSPPYIIIWPSYDMLGMAILRTIIGFCGVIATRAIAKSMSYAFVCALLGKDKNELRCSENSLENKNKIIVELSYKYFTCGMIGLNALVLLPNVFKLVGLERPTFYTEI